MTAIVLCALIGMECPQELLVGQPPWIPCELDEETLCTVEDVEDAVSSQYSRWDLNIEASFAGLYDEDFVARPVLGLQVAHLWPWFADLEAYCSEDGLLNKQPMGGGFQAGAFTTFTEVYLQAGLRLVTSIEGQALHGRLEVGGVGGAQFDGEEVGAGPRFALGLGWPAGMVVLSGHYAFGLDRPLALMVTLSSDPGDAYALAQDL